MWAQSQAGFSVHNQIQRELKGHLKIVEQGIKLFLDK